MAEKDIQTSIKSYQKRLDERKKDAIEAINGNHLWAAQLALSECSGFEAVISELEFQLECMEVSNA